MKKLPWRWMVKRTLFWLNHSRCLSKDYDEYMNPPDSECIFLFDRIYTPRKLYGKSGEKPYICRVSKKTKMAIMAT